MTAVKEERQVGRVWEMKLQDVPHKPKLNVRHAPYPLPPQKKIILGNEEIDLDLNLYKFSHAVERSHNYFILNITVLFREHALA